MADILQMCKVTGEFGGCLRDWHSPAGCQGLVLRSGAMAGCNREQPHPGSDGHGFFVPKGSELMVASRLPPESFLVIQSKHAMNKSLSGTSWAQGLKGTGQPYCSVLEPRAPQSQECTGTPRVYFGGMQKPLIRASQGSKGPGRKGWYDFEVSQNIAVI